jgi:hypothetical protein
MPTPTKKSQKKSMWQQLTVETRSQLEAVVKEVRDL